MATILPNLHPFIAETDKLQWSAINCAILVCFCKNQHKNYTKLDLLHIKAIVFLPALFLLTYSCWTLSRVNNRGSELSACSCPFLSLRLPFSHRKTLKLQNTSLKEIYTRLVLSATFSSCFSSASNEITKTGGWATLPVRKSAKTSPDFIFHLTPSVSFGFYRLVLDQVLLV